MLSNGGMHGADDSGPMSMMQGDPNRNPKRPRGRERKSCAVCYSLKTKCNGDRPCERCVRCHREDKCVDRADDDDAPKTKKPRPMKKGKTKHAASDDEEEFGLSSYSASKRSRKPQTTSTTSSSTTRPVRSNSRHSNGVKREPEQDSKPNSEFVAPTPPSNVQQPQLQQLLQSNPYAPLFSPQLLMSGSVLGQPTGTAGQAGGPNSGSPSMTATPSPFSSNPSLSMLQQQLLNQQAQVRAALAGLPVGSMSIPGLNGLSMNLNGLNGLNGLTGQPLVSPSSTTGTATGVQGGTAINPFLALMTNPLWSLSGMPGMSGIPGLAGTSVLSSSQSQPLPTTSATTTGTQTSSIPASPPLNTINKIGQSPGFGPGGHAGLQYSPRSSAFSPRTAPHSPATTGMMSASLTSPHDIKPFSTSSLPSSAFSSVSSLPSMTSGLTLPSPSMQSLHSLQARPGLLNSSPSLTPSIEDILRFPGQSVSVSALHPHASTLAHLAPTQTAQAQAQLQQLLMQPRITAQTPTGTEVIQLTHVNSNGVTLPGQTTGAQSTSRLASWDDRMRNLDDEDAMNPSKAVWQPMMQRPVGTQTMAGADVAISTSLAREAFTQLTSWMREQLEEGVKDPKQSLNQMIITMMCMREDFGGDKFDDMISSSPLLAASFPFLINVKDLPPLFGCNMWSKPGAIYRIRAAPMLNSRQAASEVPVAVFRMNYVGPGVDLLQFISKVSQTINRDALLKDREKDSTDSARVTGALPEPARSTSGEGTATTSTSDSSTAQSGEIKTVVAGDGSTASSSSTTQPLFVHSPQSPALSPNAQKQSSPPSGPLSARDVLVSINDEFTRVFGYELQDVVDRLQEHGLRALWRMASVDDWVTLMKVATKARMGFGQFQCVVNMMTKWQTVQRCLLSVRVDNDSTNISSGALMFCATPIRDEEELS